MRNPLAHPANGTTQHASLPTDNILALAASMAGRCKRPRQQGDAWQACCPAHDDNTPSLTITPKQDRVLLYCHAGCSVNAIVAALGLELKDLRVTQSPNGHHGRCCRGGIAALYDYVGANGALVFQVVRKAGPKKVFYQRRPDPAHPGAWINDIRGVTPILYHLPQVLEAVKHGETVYIVEGEKDADNLAKLGITATCNPMGAGKWRDSYSEALIGARVVIVPDNDQPGREHAAMVQRSLQGKAASVTVAELPTLPEKGDVSDWLQAGGTREQLEALAQTPAVPTPEPTETPKPHAILINAEEVTEEEITYLWEPYIPRKMATMLDGDPGVGKTGLACLLAACVSHGWPMPDQTGTPTLMPDGPANVLMVAMEDHLGAVIIPRLRQCGADLSRITFVNECQDEDGNPRPFTLADLPLLAGYMERVRPRLVYIDAIQAVLGPKVDINRANAVTALLAPLKRLAEQYDCAVLCSRHPAKPGQHVAKILYRGMGSQAFVGTVRSGLFVEQHPDDEAQALVVHYKANAGALGRTHIFSKAGGKFEWCGVTRITHAMLAGNGGPGPLPEQRLKACLWLEAELEDGSSRLASQLYDEAEERHDWSKKVVRGAAEYLKVTKTQVPGDYLWHLPPLREKRERTGVSGVSGSSGGSGGSGYDLVESHRNGCHPDKRLDDTQHPTFIQDTQDTQYTPDAPVATPPTVDSHVNTSPIKNLYPIVNDTDDDFGDLLAHLPLWATPPPVHGSRAQVDPCEHEHAGINDMGQPTCLDCGEVLA